MSANNNELSNLLWVQVMFPFFHQVELFVLGSCSDTPQSDNCLCQGPVVSVFSLTNGPVVWHRISNPPKYYLVLLLSRIFT